jgi:FkbM family methyltransferase
MRLASGAYEPAETQWYEGNVRTGDLVVELGANIGYFTLLFARLVGPTGAVRAYEPDPVLTQILERNVARNGYGNIEVRTAAVSDRTGRARFYRSHENLGDNRLFSHGDDAAVFDVDCVSLDDEFRDVPQTIGVVKMDIQGAEPAAWRGMRRLLATNPPRALLIEFWPHGISGMGEDSAAFLRAIAAAGYSIREIDKAEHVEVSELVSRLTPENRLWVNLVCERSASNESVGQ